MTFTKPLVQDGYPTVSTTESNYFLYAVGTSNALGFHGIYEALQINLSDNADDGGSTSGSGGEVGDDNDENDTDENDNDKENNDGEDSDNGDSNDSDNGDSSGNATPASEGGVVNLGDGRLQRSLEYENGALQFVFTTDELTGTITVEMTYAGLVWIAVGFGTALAMPDSVAVIALPGKEAPEKYDLTSKTFSGVNSSPQQTLSGATMNQNSTHTTMTFTKLLQEDGEPTVSLTESNNFLYAIGTSNDLGFHAIGQAFVLNFADSSGATPMAVGSPNRNLWKVHGICMALSWAILVPLAIASSVIRDILPLPDGMWFQVHRGLNSLGVLLTIIGFGIAVHTFNKEGNDHFTLKKHHKIGLVVFLFAVLQAISGILRPHAPHQQAAVTEDEEVQHPAVAPLNQFETVEVGDSEEMMPSPDDKINDTTPKGEQQLSAEPKTKVRLIWEYQHRILGTVTLVLAWYNCDSGLELYSDRFDSKDWAGALWGLIAGIAITTLGLSLYINFVKKRKD